MSLLGGDKLNQVLGDIAERLGKDLELQVGFLEGATYPDGTSVPMVAAISNFGAPAARIPARRFFSSMVEEKSGSWGERLAGILKGADYHGKTALLRMGAGIASDLQVSIVQTNEPALSPITLMLKKMRSEDQNLIISGATVGEAARRVKAGESYSGQSTKPLIDTAHLINSVEYAVGSSRHHLPPYKSTRGR